MLHHRADLRNSSMFRLALKVLFLLITLAALNISLAGETRADCPSGWGLCSDGLCAPIGSQCCVGGTYCPGGNGCWSGSSGVTFCCRDGSVGYRDGGCAPVGADYCGNSRYCSAGAGSCCNGGQSCCSERLHFLKRITGGQLLGRKSLAVRLEDTQVSDHQRGDSRSRDR